MTVLTDTEVEDPRLSDMRLLHLRGFSRFPQIRDRLTA